jgi:hypothetical protein
VSNLGLYKTIVVAAKAVGGPAKLIALTIGGSFAIGVGGTLGGQAGYKRIVRRMKARSATNPGANAATQLEDIRTYTVVQASDSNGTEVGTGLLLSAGDAFKVIARDGEAVIIEVDGNDSNPHVVSADLLASISDFGGTARS